MSMNRTSAINTLASSLAGSTHVGDLVWSEVRDVGDATKREDVLAALRAEGLAEEIAPEERSPQAAFGRALSECRNLDVAPNITIERESLRSRIALIRASSGSGVAKETKTWARVEVDETADSLAVVWNDALIAANVDGHEEAKLALSVLEARYRRHRDYLDHAEVGSMITTALLDWFGGVRVKRDGGVYFVPASGAAEVRAFRRVVQTIGASDLPFIPAYDNAETRATMGPQVTNALFADIERIVDGLSKLGGEGGNVRASSLEARLDALSDLQAQAEACAAVLEGRQEAISAALDAARSKVRAMMELGDE